MKAKLMNLTAIAVVVVSCSSPQQKAEDTAKAPEEEAAAEVSSVNVVGKEVQYATEEVNMIGYVASDANNNEKRPGILVVHEWWGHNAHSRERAEMLAELGYVALAVDMYGEGQNTNHPSDAQQFMGAALSNLGEAKARFEEALAQLKAQPGVDTAKIGVIGFCFGGTVALSMASAGYDLDGIVAFHAGLGLPIMPDEPGKVKAKVLVLNGEADPMVSQQSVADFKQVMDGVGADYEYVSYPGVKHAFTNKRATAIGEEHGLPLAYDEEADKDSWERMTAFFANTF